MRDFGWDGLVVAVTGGAGMVGRALVALLGRYGATVRVIDDYSRASPVGLPRNGVLPDSIFEWAYADMTDEREARQALAGAEVVFNLAAKVTGMHYNRRHHGAMLSANLKLQFVPLDAAITVGVERFVQVSSACVYPQNAPVPTEERWGHEGEPEPTNQGYGWAKRMGELATRFAASEHGLKAIVMRPSNMYGPGDNWDPRSSHVLPALILRVLNGEGTPKNPLTFYGSGAQTRALLHSHDAAEGLVRGAEIASTDCPLLNLGHDEQTPLTEMAKWICREVRPDVDPVLRLDYSEPDGYINRAASITRQKALLGWSPPNRVRESLPQMIEEGRRWLEKHPS